MQRERAMALPGSQGHKGFPGSPRKLPDVGRLLLSSTVVQQVGQFPFPGPAKPDVQTWLVLNPPGASPAMTPWTSLHKVPGAAGSRL